MGCPIENNDSAELIGYCAKTLDPVREAELELHIKVCAACAAFTQAQRSVWEALDEWKPAPVSADFNARLYRRIEQEQRLSWWQRIVRPAVPYSWKPAFPLAVACILLAAAFLIRSPEAVVDSGSEARANKVDIEQVERTLEDLEMLTPLTEGAGGYGSTSVI